MTAELGPDLMEGASVFVVSDSSLDYADTLVVMPEDGSTVISVPDPDDYKSSMILVLDQEGSPRYVSESEDGEDTMNTVVFGPDGAELVSVILDDDEKTVEVLEDDQDGPCATSMAQCARECGGNVILNDCQGDDASYTAECRCGTEARTMEPEYVPDGLLGSEDGVTMISQCAEALDRCIQQCGGVAQVNTCEGDESQFIANCQCGSIANDVEVTVGVQEGSIVGMLGALMGVPPPNSLQMMPLPLQVMLPMIDAMVRPAPLDPEAEIRDAYLATMMGRRGMGPGHGPHGPPWGPPGPRGPPWGPPGPRGPPWGPYGPPRPPWGPRPDGPRPRGNGPVGILGPLGAMIVDSFYPPIDEEIEVSPAGQAGSAKPMPCDDAEGRNPSEATMEEPLYELMIDERPPRPDGFLVEHFGIKKLTMRKLLSLGTLLCGALLLVSALTFCCFRRRRSAEVLEAVDDDVRAPLLSNEEVIELLKPLPREGPAQGSAQASFVNPAFRKADRA
eukprot:scaffold7382_cov406-Prasinococcus_capsulatus_cf.AAC.25